MAATMERLTNVVSRVQFKAGWLITARLQFFQGAGVATATTTENESAAFSSDE